MPSSPGKSSRRNHASCQVPGFNDSCRLQEETAKVEEHLLDNRHDKTSFTDAIVRCLALSKANSFENLLEPLQKLLRLSPPVASTLARPDLFSRLGQKLHHNKAAVRLNLLRIISSICDSTEQQGGLLATYGLLDAIRELENDPAILVRDMAGKLVQSSERSSNSLGLMRRPTSRRKSTSTPSPNPFSGSTPSTPSSNRNSQSRSFLETRETPRHSRNALSGSSFALRPGSRDGTTSSLGSALNGSAAAARSRMPRGMSNRLSQVEFLQDDDKAQSSLNRRSSVMPRRRRPTNAESEWT